MNSELYVGVGACAQAEEQAGLPGLLRQVSGHNYSDLTFHRHLQYYLPDESAVNKDFLKAVLSGEK